MERTVDILIEISIYSAVITAFILLFRVAFKKRISPKVQYAMWLLLVLRLMLPVTIESGFHVESLLPERPAPVIQEESIFEAENPAINEIPAVNMASVTEAAPVQPDFNTQGENAVPPSISQEIPESTVVSIPEVKEPVFNIRWRIVAFWTWAAGALVFGLWMMIVKLRFYEDMHSGLASVSPRVYAIYDECCASLGVKPITMWAVDRAISPGIAFFTYPVLLLPASMDGDEEKLRYAFLHELTHKRRYDHHMTALLAALRIIYWFNPAVHIGFSEMRSDMETACDAEVIAFVGKEQKRGYLTAILELFSYATRPQLGMSQASSRRMAKQRMKGAFMRERTTFLGRAAALMLAVIMLVGCFTTACQSAPVEVEDAPEDNTPVTEVEAEEALPDPNEVQTYKWSESYLAAGSVKVNVNASLDIPVNANYPVYKVEYSEFTKENLRKITDAVIGEVSDVELTVDYSQGYLEEGYITEADLEENRPTETEISPYSNYSCRDENDTEWEIFSKLRSVTVGRQPLTDYNVQTESVVIAGDAYIGEPKGTTLDNVKISREEAVQIAQEVINSLGLSNVELYSCEKARAINHSHKTLTEGWRLDYVYRYGELTSNYTEVSRTIYKPFERFVEPLRCDQLSMFVDETGIVRYDSTTPSFTMATIKDTRVPLTFEETKTSIKTVIEDLAQSLQGYPSEYELNILNISLRSCIVQSEYNSHTGYMIPTWMVEMTFGNRPKEEMMNYSQLFISAIDGTQISDRYMTENGRRIAQEYDRGTYASKTITPEDAALRDAILRLYPLADEIAAKGFEAKVDTAFYKKTEALAQTMGLSIIGAGKSGSKAQPGCTIEIPDANCSMELCNMYAAVMFAAVPNLYDISIGNTGHFAYYHQRTEGWEQLLSTAVGDTISREEAEAYWAGLTKPLEEYGASGSGIRELLRLIAEYSGVNLVSAELTQETPLHVSLLQPTPVPTPTPAPATGEHAWRAGKLAIEPYRDNDTSLLELSHYGISLSGNGTEQTESMLKDWFSNDIYSRDGQELLEVHRTLRGTLKLDVDLIQHSAENTKWNPDSETYGAVEYAPTWLPGHKNRVLRMTRRYERGTEDSIPYVTTIYSVLIQYNNSDVVLMFRFLNAKKINGEWQLYQTDYDCEKWMRTFQINGAPNSIVDRAQILVGKPYKTGAYGPDAFDSSGLVYYVVTQAGVYVERLENCQRYADNANWQKITNKADLQPGDILFFHGGDTENIQHAGIYIGNSKMIDASSANGKVTERSCDTDYWNRHFAFARRVV